MVALAACSDAPRPDDGARAPVPRWVDAPPPAVAWLGPLRGRLGRGDAAVVVVPTGLVAGPAGDAAWTALHDVHVIAVPGDGSAARAVVAGTDAAGHGAVELVDVDRGVVRWRVADAGRVVAVADGAVVVTQDGELHGLDLATGARRWQSRRVFVVATDDRVAVAADAAGAPAIDVVAAGDGAVRRRVALPSKVDAGDVRAVCDGGELVAVTAGSAAALVRVVDGKPAWRVAQAVLGGAVTAVDACDDAMLATIATPPALVAIARATGAVTGRVVGARGWWTAPGASHGEIDVARGDGVWRHARDLADDGALVPALPALGEPIAARGDRRVVRATRHAAALLDAAGVRALLPVAEPSIALGDAMVLAGGIAGAPPRAFALPDDARRDVRVPADHAGVALAAELRDLPAVQPFHGDEAIVAGSGGAGEAASDVAVVLDGEDAAAVYARAGGVVGKLALATPAWAWHRDAGCRAHAVARGVVACAGDAVTGLAAADGSPRWTAPVVADRVTAAGDLVIAFAGARATILDARDGRVLGTLASDDGGPVLAAPVAPVGRAPTTLVLAVEQGRLVALVPAAAMVPLWSLAIDGTARAVAAAGDGAIVELDGGDAYRVDLGGVVTPLPALGVAWRGDPDVLAATCAGGPVPPSPMPDEPPPVVRKPAAPASTTTQAPSADENLPPMSVPWPPPPAMAPSWQLTLYELVGAMRLRDDYALPLPVEVAPRVAGAPIAAAAAGTLLVVDPHTGAPTARFAIPDGAAPFATRVDGAPIVGVVLGGPLRVVVLSNGGR
jgi:hypothetical protein